MKKVLLCLLLTASIAMTGQNHIPTLNTYTLAAGPNHIPSPTLLTPGTILWISDAQSVSDCSSAGGGILLSFCYVTNTHTYASLGSGGGGMIWPGGGAGIPNYSGASAWGATYSASNLIPLNFLSANLVAAVTNDTNVTGSISAQNMTLGWVGTLAAGRLNANVVQAVTNDTNITGSISAQNLTLGWTGTLANGRIANPQTTVDGATCTLGSTCSTPAIPLFSTAQTGLSMQSTVGNIGSSVNMTTPGAAGTYRFTVQVLETAAGSSGCTGGTVAILLAYKDAYTGVVYSGVTGYMGFTTVNSGGALVGAAAMTTAAPSIVNNFTSISREFLAASGTAISYQIYQNTGSTGCSGAQPVFAVRPALYGPLGY